MDELRESRDKHSGERKQWHEDSSGRRLRGRRGRKRDTG